MVIHILTVNLIRAEAEDMMMANFPSLPELERVGQHAKMDMVLDSPLVGFPDDL